MTLLYYDECFLQHDTGQHPECAERLRKVSRHLAEIGLLESCTRPEWQAVDKDVLSLVHSPKYIDSINHYAARGGGRIESDTVVSARSYDVALRASGAVCDAVRRVAAGQDTSALCLVRPPGHHALRTSAMGFCLFNNVAVGAKLATRQLRMDRVLIVDWDVHHGNGTQDAFWLDEQVGFFSIHRWPFYPGTGSKDETGGGPALGTTKNVPVEFGTDRKEYKKRFEKGITDFAKRIKPDLVIISAGFDSHRSDPIGSLGLETEDFAELTTSILEIASVHCQGRLVSVLEGGYNTDVLPKCVSAHLNQLVSAQSREEP